jgi:hypothetical protein
MPVEHGFHFAQTYIERGWSILHLDGKKPCGPWKVRQETRMTLGEALGLWGILAKNPPNIGIVTGAISGLTASDCETPDDCQFWEERYGGSSLVVETGGGGRHYYYRHTGLGNAVRLFGRGIDRRGEGGYVVAPPSIHPRTDKPYRWLSGFDTYSLDDVPPYPVIAESATTEKAVRVEAIRDDVYRRIYRATRWAAKVDPAVEHNGWHNKIFSFCCAMRQKFGLTAEQAYPIVLAYNSRCQPPMCEKGLRHKMNDAFKVSED